MEGLIPAALGPGKPWPMGAHWDGSGINFAVFSAHASAMELCLFDDTGQREIARLPLPGHTSDVWHGHLAGAAPGLVYGLRAQGPWRPDDGHRFNAARLLLDPYAREIVGRFDWSADHVASDRITSHMPDPEDNAAGALKARVVADRFDWGDDAPPAHPVTESVIYEMHVKGFSRLNPEVPQALRGTYAGLAHDASIAHLKRLGITAVSLLPVQQHLDEERLARSGLVNYWGYNTIGFFAVEPTLAAARDARGIRDEFRGMVKRLHEAGIEVLLDVVYNHTAEAGDQGPTISLRGLDNAVYYRLSSESRSHYENYSGCGNTLDVRHPKVLQMVTDSLRYWVSEMHVDGFRFDLAPVLGRGHQGFDRGGTFFAAVAQDPVLSRVKLIAEPWDLGPGGYQLGGFPRGWLEWNDKFRDTLRLFWLQSRSTRGEWARRLCASADVYQAHGRSPSESVNYVVSHDGFTLRDLVCYRNKHNHDNGENNRDGHDHNLSINCGVEGPTEDPTINGVRARLQRALLANTLLSQGTPMFAAGDEMGHTQRGNNNGYCQDNEITWIDWARRDEAMVAFTARVLALRRQAMPLNNHWYSGLTDPHGLHDLIWLAPDGHPLHGHDWNDGSNRVLGCLIGKPGRAKAPLLILANANAEDCSFMLPAGVWRAWLDTSNPHGDATWHGQGEVPFPLAAHSMMVFAAAGADIDL